ncbi:hypothetical protein Pcinc_041975 [Petrolisthes cinctipes]|uniref:Uncharacterized protein n=1 Tax=Petrolisthes cinctipes TaxID=88211 RepID=A0AAE1BJ26_PETCI|nr:hypothetical protein Pcinc_041975 [Petrolisthes cinctipes]
MLMMGEIVSVAVTYAERERGGAKRRCRRIRKEEKNTGAKGETYWLHTEKKERRMGETVRAEEEGREGQKESRREEGCGRSAYLYEKEEGRRDRWKGMMERRGTEVKRRGNTEGQVSIHHT